MIAFRSKKLKLLVIITGLILVLGLPVVATYRHFIQDSPEGSMSNKVTISKEVAYTSEEEIDEAQERNGVPFNRGRVEASNLEYYWINATVVDGSFSCYVFNKKTYQIYGSTYTTAGFNSPSKSVKTYYQNQEYDIDFIEQTLSSVCNFSTQ